MTPKTEERERSEREALTAQVTDTIDEIIHIRQQAGYPSLKHRAGRPATNLDTLRAKLSNLRNERAWLHSKWIADRGDEVFSGGAARLAELGIIAAPQPPKSSQPRKRGRPAGSRVGKLLTWYVGYVEQYFLEIGDPVMTAAERIALADEILRQPYKPAREICADYQKTRKLKPAHRRDGYETVGPSRAPQFYKARRTRSKK